MKRNEPIKIAWHGTIISVQPRTNVWRYRLDNRTHSHIGYNLFIDGVANNNANGKADGVNGNTDNVANNNADGVAINKANSNANGEADSVNGRFAVAISKKQQMTHVFRIGDEVKGTAWTKMYSVSDYADYYRAGGLKVINRAVQAPSNPPPYHIEPPDLATYERRGARMLSFACYRRKCFTCAWAAMAAVSIEYDWGGSCK